MMTPIVLRVHDFNFGWSAHDAGEPAHVHVYRQGDRNSSAKFWLKKNSVELAHNDARFSDKELSQAKEIIMYNRDFFVARWFDFFNAD